MSSQSLALRTHETLLQKQALETALLRAGRDERRAKNGERSPKRYRLGPENADGTMPIDVADRNAENWRQREMCLTPQRAQRRLLQLKSTHAKAIPGTSQTHATADQENV